MRPTTIVLTHIDSTRAVAELVRQAAAAPHVAGIVADAEAPAHERWAPAWREIERSKTTYALTDADPLQPLVDAYVSGWQNERLEDIDLARLSTSGRGLPDFYLIVDPGERDDDARAERFLRREWFFGVVASAAPRRIVPLPASMGAEPSAAQVLACLRRLPAGAALPAPDELASRARRRVPGQPALASA